MQRLWHKAGELGLAIELHISPDQARGLTQALKHLPSYPVIIDHLAEPGLGNADEYQDVLTLACYPHVWMKLSALERLSSELGDSQSLKELVNRVAEKFGPHRLIWGGGYPDYLDALLDTFTPEERDRVKGKNLAELIPGWDDNG